MIFLRSLSFVLCSVFLVVSFAADCAAAAWWPQFHGPNRDNKSADTGLLEKWPEGGPPLAWKRSDCGRGFAGVSIAEGTIFTSGDFDGVEKVLALDMNGQPLWKTPNGSSWTGPYPGARTTPTYDDGLVYQMNPAGRLAAFEAKTGEEVWAVELCAAFGARYGTWAMAENVAVDGDRLFCTPGGPKALMAALDKKTGKTIWVNSELDETAAYCSPILATRDGVRQLITLTQKSVVCVETQTGKLLWSHPHVTPNDQNVDAPLYADGYVFVSSGHSAGSRMLKINPDGRGVTEVWADKALDNCHGGVLSIDGCLYGSACRSGGKGFFCADLFTGATRYRDKKLTKFSQTFADGKIYGLMAQGEMLLIAPNRDQSEVISRFQTPDESPDEAFSHPVVCGGRLYVRHGTNLYAYDVRKTGK